MNLCGSSGAGQRVVLWSTQNLLPFKHFTVDPSLHSMYIEGQRVGLLSPQPALPLLHVTMDPSLHVMSISGSGSGIGSVGQRVLLLSTHSASPFKHFLNSPFGQEIHIYSGGVCGQRVGLLSPQPGLPFTHVTMDPSLHLMSISDSGSVSVEQRSGALSMQSWSVAKHLFFSSEPGQLIYTY